MSESPPQVYDLAAARPDNWFDGVLEQSSDFEKACQIIGRNTLGLALIAGARIYSITANPHTQNLTNVEFTIGGEQTAKQLTLPEFRETVARYLLSPLQNQELPPNADLETLQAHIGGRYMLEAALFYVEPLELRHDLGLSEIEVRFNGVQHVLTLEDFREVLDERVRSELGLDSKEQSSIDLAVVDQAERANAHGNWGATIALLNPWLTPISMLLRTGEAESLSEEVRGRLSVSLDLLGTAYSEVGELDAANEVLRLGVQWAGDSGKAGALFLALGRAAVAGDKHGEAIGLLRRAIRLDCDEKEALPLLVESFVAREQLLAALVCAERARKLGADAQRLGAASAGIERRIGDPWPRFLTWMSSPE